MPKPFEKNDPRINRRGRPKKGETLTDLLREKIEATKTTREKLTRKEKIIEKLIALAEAGDLSALRYVFDRLDGRPKESLELTDGGIDARLREIMSEGGNHDRNNL